MGEDVLLSFANPYQRLREGKDTTYHAFECEDGN